ncbi:hypothetical protein KAU11_03590 [Candidatus Babeliales bacterium]|nr:hypothetical protein [Candidatus Babeliales bacterium]
MKKLFIMAFIFLGLPASVGAMDSFVKIVFGPFNRAYYQKARGNTSEEVVQNQTLAVNVGKALGIAEAAQAFKAKKAFEEAKQDREKAKQDYENPSLEKTGAVYREIVDGGNVEMQKMLLREISEKGFLKKISKTNSQSFKKWKQRFKKIKDKENQKTTKLIQKKLFSYYAEKSEVSTEKNNEYDRNLKDFNELELKNLSNRIVNAITSGYSVTAFTGVGIGLYGIAAWKNYKAWCKQQEDEGNQTQDGFQEDGFAQYILSLKALKNVAKKKALFWTGTAAVATGTLCAVLGSRWFNEATSKFYLK